MKTLALRSLNLERSKLLINGFLATLPLNSFDAHHLIRNTAEIEAVFHNSSMLSLSQVGRQEPIIRPLFPPFLQPRERVVLNSDLANVVSKVNVEHLKAAVHHYREEPYIVCSSRDGQTVHILMKTGCLPVDRLKALLEGLAIASSNLPTHPSRELVSSLFHLFLRLISSHGWDDQRILLAGPHAKTYSVLVE